MIRILMAALVMGVRPIAAANPEPTVESPLVERVSTLVPFPRGLAMVDGRLYVLCRGRVRGVGGVTAEIDDQAGTIYVIDPDLAEPIDAGPPGAAVRRNGVVLARPHSPPFRLWDRAAEPPEADRATDRPYCTLRHHAASASLYLCAFSGIDKARTPRDPVAFRKNRSDAILRYDLRTASWHEVERHDAGAGRRYPHHDPASHPPPHGWLDGPDNCLPLGHWLYAVAKENSRLVRYDLRALEASPAAGPPPGEVVLDAVVDLAGSGPVELLGQSALAFDGGWLYLAYRTSSVIIRLPLDGSFTPLRPIRAELVARFDPHDPLTGHSADLTDMTFDETGRLYVVSAQPARVHRFRPDPERVYDARHDAERPWADLAAITGNPAMKSENVLAHGGWLYVTSGDGYGYQGGADGTVYRIATSTGSDRSDDRESGGSP